MVGGVERQRAKPRTQSTTKNEENKPGEETARGQMNRTKEEQEGDDLDLIYEDKSLDDCLRRLPLRCGSSKRQEHEESERAERIGNGRRRSKRHTKKQIAGTEELEVIDEGTP